MSFALASCAQSQPAPTTAKPASLPIRVLIVSGGPTPDYNQYAIESNARYLESLTARARSQRIYFADGSKTSRTISTLEPVPNRREELALAWILNQDSPADRVVFRAPRLRRLDGAATKSNVVKAVETFARNVPAGEKGLLYFTGHGLTGRKMGLLGLRTVEDAQNTTYSLWRDETISTRELASALKNWPAKAPLTLVMVQCHAGGFANVLFEGGDPAKPIVNRDFCGFFAATGERQAAGCTSEVDERNYQDFTTHFFAALSGISRDGRRITGADWDQNGQVSGLEALSWANLHDKSIDVPLCTSDQFLRAIFPTSDATLQTPYSQILAAAKPWQKATLNGLSQILNLGGETRLAQAQSAQTRLARQLQRENFADAPIDYEKNDLGLHFDALEKGLRTRFPDLKTPRRSSRYAAAHRGALRWLKTQPRDVEVVARAYEEWQGRAEAVSVREAMFSRFLMAAHTIALEKRLNQSGTAAQKAAFARLRAAENRSPIQK